MRQMKDASSDDTVLEIILSSLFQLCEDLFNKINYNIDNSMSYSVEVRTGVTSFPCIYSKPEVVTCHTSKLTSCICTGELHGNLL